MVTFGFMETEGITIGGVTYSDDLATILSAPKDIRALELIRGVRCIGRCAFEGCKSILKLSSGRVAAAAVCKCIFGRMFADFPVSKCCCLIDRSAYRSVWMSVNYICHIVTTSGLYIVGLIRHFLSP